MKILDIFFIILFLRPLKFSVNPLFKTKITPRHTNMIFFLRVSKIWKVPQTQTLTFLANPCKTTLITEEGK